MPQVRRLRPAIAAPLLLLMAVPFVARAGAPTGDDLRNCPVVGQVTSLADNWAKINSPEYTAEDGGSSQFTTFAVPATQPAMLFGTNSSAIKTSLDGGCHWDRIYPVPVDTSPAPVAAPKATNRVIAQLAAPRETSLWISSYDDENGVPIPHVEMTPNGTPIAGHRPKESFVSYDRGLPFASRPVALAVGATTKLTQPYVMLESFDPTASDGTLPARHIYRLDTTDDPTPNGVLKQRGANVSWTETTQPDGFGRIDGMTVNKNDPMGLWVWSGTKYAFSADGGKNWQQTFTAPGVVTAIGVTPFDDALVAVQVPDGAREVTLHRGRNPKNFSLYVAEPEGALPVPATSIATGQLGAWAVSGPKGSYGWDLRRNQWTPVHPDGVPPFVQIQMGTTGIGGRYLLGEVGGALYRSDLYDGELFLRIPDNLKGTGNYGNIKTYGLTHPEMQVAQHVVTVAPGQQVTDLTDFGLNADPAELDVYFLIDTTTSMDASLAGLAADAGKIAVDLHNRTHGLACFGLGEFKDEGLATTTSNGAYQPYTRHMPVTCGDAAVTELQRELREDIKVRGGNNDPDEDQLLALDQAALGSGWPNPLVPYGQGANFHTGDVKKVIVLITDAAFTQNANLPSMSRVIQDLNAEQINVVGIVQQDPTNNLGKAISAVTQVVQGTHTLAANGIDCDGDNKVEVPANGPLLCVVSGTGDRADIGPPIIGLLLSMRDMRDMGVQVSDPSKVVAKVEGRLNVQANMRQENHLGNKFHLTCAASQNGQDLRVGLRGLKKGLAVAEAEIIVQCRAPKIAPPPPPPPPPAPEPFIFIAKPVVPVLFPQFQPPPVNNPPANINPNVGFSQQEEQQFQLATVSQDASEQQQDDEEVELAMSAVHENDAAAAGFVLGCAMFVSAATAVGWGYRRRTQKATRTAYARATVR